MTAWRRIRSSRERWPGEWPPEESGGSFLHLILDAPSPVNALSAAVMAELEVLLPSLRAEPGVSALILWSAKAEHFIAGADIHEIDAVAGAAEGTEKAAAGQRIFEGLASLPFPTFAVIQGTCLGGGLELCLALDYRLAVDAPRVRIGLPEVTLGIIPGFGGTQRLPRLVGLRAALPWILAGKRLPARAAHAKGLVDLCLPEEGLRMQAMRAIVAILDDRGRRIRTRRSRLRGGLGAWILERNPVGRALLRRGARRRILAESGGHYPAPLAALEAVMASAASELDRGLALEARLCGELIPGSVSRNLRALFFDSEAARHLRVEGGREAPASFVGVLGAGVMGAGIAALLLENGLEARVRDLDANALGRGLGQLAKQLDQSAERQRLRSWQREERLGRLTYTTTAAGFRRADVVIEAIVERLAVKQAALAEMERELRADAIFATNTSALGIGAIQAGARHPERVVGLHFFNPVHRMPLVEVIPGERTAPWAVAGAVQLAQRLGKFPVLVKDSPGFLVNRLLFPYLDSACRLLERGVSGPRIDAAARTFGLPMGPFRLLDEVGIDIALEVGATLYAAFGERARGSRILETLVEKRLLGRKSGSGFYRYGGRSKREAWNDEIAPSAGRNDSFSAPRVISHLLDRMVDEAARCLEEEIVSSPATIDLAMVLGTGFPAFRGGPLRHADGEDLRGVVDRLRGRAAEGESSAPSSLLEEIARSGGQFHAPKPVGATAVAVHSDP